MSRCTNYIRHYSLDAEHFDYFTNEDRTDRAYEKLFRKFIVRLAGGAGRTLDIGSGSGWISVLPHENLYYVDLSLRNLQSLKTDTSSPVLADAVHLPFKDESMNLIVASEIMEHLNSPDAAAREILRVMKPDGKAVVSTPYREKIRYTLCIHCNQPTPLNAHLTSFDKGSLVSLFPGCNVKVYIFGSKVMTLLRAAVLFENLPLWIWRLVNYPLIKLVDKAQHIVLELQKTSQS